MSLYKKESFNAKVNLQFVPKLSELIAILIKCVIVFRVKVLSHKQHIPATEHYEPLRGDTAILEALGYPWKQC